MIEGNIFLLLGSNEGDRSQNLATVIAHIAREGIMVERQSRVYETAPWGKTDQQPFLNQALQVMSAMQPTAFLQKILAIEKAMGRVRNERWAARLIDIDIIYFGASVCNDKDLVIPHPHLTDRRFVLVPLVEISASFIHPQLGKTNAQLLAACNDTLDVKEFIS